MIKISIVVPVYNTAEYLKKCIDSLVNQTLKDIEIIILNDGSTDDSDNIIKSYNDNRIIYIKKDNEGIAITRNMGINIATGKYITFVDSDDYLDVKFCKKMYRKAETEKCEIVICDYYNCMDNHLKKRNLISFKNTKLIDTPKIINEINLGPCNKIYSSGLIKEKNILFPIGIKYEDAPFVCESLVNAKNIGKIDEPLSYFNEREGSETTVRDARIQDIFEIMDMIIIILKNTIDKKNLNRFIITTLLNYAVQCRYISDRIIRDKFINSAYEYFDKNIDMWKKDNYFKNLSFIKKMVLKNKSILKIYCSIFQLRM